MSEQVAGVATKHIFDSATGRLIAPGEAIPAHLDVAQPKNGVIPGTRAPSAKAALAKAGDATAVTAKPVTAGSPAAKAAAASAAGDAGVVVEKGGKPRAAAKAKAKVEPAATAAEPAATAAEPAGGNGGGVLD